ncbi:MAG: 6-phosphofructokinase [bacterium]|nr:6-phosphofructokinase [bacterium]
MKRIAVLTSGGDAPGMNAAIRAVVRKGLHLEREVIGFRRGYAGLVADDAIMLNAGSVADIIHRGGTFLRTARSDEFLTSAGFAKALSSLKRHAVDGLIVIGGDGSFRGAQKLFENGILTVGIPGTIDNDIPGTDECIGFDTAVNTAVEAIDKIRDTATSHERIFIIEVMGRASGHIALAAGLAGGAESILIPEKPIDLDEICLRLKRGANRGKLHSIIVVCEGAGSAYSVGDYISTHTEFETRVTVLGHVQRGGAPTVRDRLLASKMGSAAVDALVSGIGGVIIGIKKGQLITVGITAALNEATDFDFETYYLASVLAK